jgi:hypothetical protein
MEGTKEIVAALGQLKEDLDQRHLENIGAQAVTDAKVVEAIRGIDELRKAFPDNDPDGHRRYHEAIIASIEDRGAFYRTLRDELAKKGLWALVIVVGLALWQYLKLKVTT